MITDLEEKAKCGWKLSLARHERRLNADFPSCHFYGTANDCNRIIRTTKLLGHWGERERHG